MRCGMRWVQNPEKAIGASIWRVLQMTETFAREVPISPPALGACGCCGMRAFADERGTLFILYRAAAENIHRDMTLLISTNQGVTFHDTTVGPWELNACPMS